MKDHVYPEEHKENMVKRILKRSKYSNGITEGQNKQSGWEAEGNEEQVSQADS